MALNSDDVRRAYVEVPPDEVRPTNVALAERFGCAPVTISRLKKKDAENGHDWDDEARAWDLVQNQDRIADAISPKVYVHYDDDEEKDFDSMCLDASRKIVKAINQSLDQVDDYNVRPLESMARTLQIAQNVGKKAMGEEGDLAVIIKKAEQDVSSLSDAELRRMADATN